MTSGSASARAGAVEKGFASAMPARNPATWAE